jgi:hypothetical protein
MRDASGNIIEQIIKIRAVKDSTFANKKEKLEKIGSIIKSSILTCLNEVEFCNSFTITVDKINSDINSLMCDHEVVYDEFPKIENTFNPQKIYDLMNQWDSKASTFDKVNILKKSRVILLEYHSKFDDYRSEVDRFMDEDFRCAIDNLDGDSIRLYDAITIKDSDIKSFFHDLKTVLKEVVDSIYNNVNSQQQIVLDKNMNRLVESIDNVSQEFEKINCLSSEVYEEAIGYLRNEFDGGDWVGIPNLAEEFAKDLKCLIEFIEFCASSILMVNDVNRLPIEFYEDCDNSKANEKLLDICNKLDSSVDQEDTNTNLVLDEITKIQTEIDSLNLRYQELLKKINKQ